MLVAKRIALLFLAFNLANAAPEVALAQENLQKKNFSIKALPINEALHEFSQQSGVQVMFLSESDEQFYSQEITGSYTFYEAMQQMLAGTILKVQYVNEKIIRIDGPKEKRPGQKDEPRGRKIYLSEPPDKIGYITDGAPMRVASVSAGEEAGGAWPASSESSSGVSSSTPEIMVLGSKILNMDIRRTEDDPQPYVVFDREEIERVSASGVDELLRRKLTSVTSAETGLQNSGSGRGGLSEINLRGLGAGQTLILVDGRRVGSVNMAGGAGGQPDINGIPLSAIERIEVLPATASGIYGGGATGGVVNVVMRKDYSGLELNSSYMGAFDGGGAERRIDFGLGFALGSKTNVTITGSYRDSAPLLAGDRPFENRARDFIESNFPNYYVNEINPPLGGTTNIRSVSGADLVLRPEYGGVSLGSPVAHVPGGYEGVASDSGQGLLAGAGGFNLQPPAGIQTGGVDRALMAESAVKSISMSLRRTFSDNFDGFFDFFTSENVTKHYSSALTGLFTLPSGVPGNPFGQAVRVRVPVTDFRDPVRIPYNSSRGVVGGIWNIGGGWRMTVDYVRDVTKYSREVPSSVLVQSAATDVNSGILNIFRDVNVFPLGLGDYLNPPVFTPYARTILDSGSVRVSGLLPISVPGGRVGLTSMLEVKKERLGDHLTRVSESQVVANFRRQQSVNSAYVEARVPVVSDMNPLPMIKELELQLAVRWDAYNLNGANSGDADRDDRVAVNRELSSIDPTIALRWVPLSGVALRASYGTGFVPPGLAQLVPAEPRIIDASSRGIVDPRRGGEGVGEVVVYGGGNPLLNPEESKSFSAGFLISDIYSSGVRFSADWVRIRKTGNVMVLSLSQVYVDDELSIPGLIERAPDDGMGFGVGPIVSYRSSSLNVARYDVDAIDFSLGYAVRDVGFGAFDFNLSATKNLKSVGQVTQSSIPMDNLGSSSYLKWRANSFLGWSYNNFSTGWSVSYYPSYCPGVCSFMGSSVFNSSMVDSQIYHDLFVKYNTKLFGGGYVKIGVDNVSGAVPPLNSFLFPYYSSHADPRLRRYSVAVGFSF